jgi:hypothetical protein
MDGVLLSSRPNLKSEAVTEHNKMNVWMPSW